ncbi:MAG: radical SAM protein [Methanosarcinales archaeon]
MFLHYTPLKYRKFRIDIEVVRGCKWNCKFCQICKFYKYKEIHFIQLCRKIESVPETDWKHYKLGIVAPDLMNYSHIEEFFDYLNISAVQYIGSFSVSSHSSSIEKLKCILSEPTKLIFKNISVGIEGASERLRKLVNKPMSNDLFKELLYIIAEDQKVQSLRLHFIKGLPTEGIPDYYELIDIFEEVIPLPNDFPLRISFVQFVPMVGSEWQYMPFTDGDELYNNIFRRWYKERLMWKKGLILEKSMLGRGKWVEWMINKGGEEMVEIFRNWTIQYNGPVRTKFYERFKKSLQSLNCCNSNI